MNEYILTPFSQICAGEFCAKFVLLSIHSKNVIKYLAENIREETREKP